MQQSKYIMFFLCLLFGNRLFAADLVEIFQQAEANDPQYLQAVSSHKAALEYKPQALAKLLPNVTISSNAATNQQSISIQTFNGGGNDISFNSYGYSLDVRQPIFHWDRYLALKQADSRILLSQAQLDTALQDLITRVAQKYFEVLAAKDSLEFANADKLSLEKQLQQAKERFEVGLIAITDKLEAQAGYDRSVANQIRAQNDVDNKLEELREITGSYISDLAPLGDNVPLVNPQPDSIDTWTEVSQKQNLGIVAAKQQLEVAQEQIKIEKAGHLPTLDLVGTQGFNKSGGRFGDTEVDANTIGLQLNVPIFSGGFVSSRVRQANENFNQAYQQLEQEFRQAQRQTRESFLGVISGISQVKALEQTVISSESSLKATESGFEVGTRTAVDVVNSQQSLLQAKRDYSQAKYSYILNTLNLKRAAGTLTPDDLNSVNKWLK